MADLRQHLEDPPDEVIRQVLEHSGYRQMLLDSQDEDDQERLANIEELITAAQQFAAEDDSRTIGDFLEQITLASDVDGWDEQQDCVSVMTLHAAKGLEFPVVYMLAVEQGLLPHERSLAKDEDVEEERRLCFVGMTRAKQELLLVPRPAARIPRPGAVRRAEHVPRRAAGRRRRDDDGPQSPQRRPPARTTGAADPRSAADGLDAMPVNRRGPAKSDENGLRDRRHRRARHRMAGAKSST